MPLIAIKLSADTSDFLNGIEQVLDTLDRFAESAARTQRAAESMKFKAPSAESASGPSDNGAKSMADSASNATETAGQIRGAFASAMAPLGQFATTLAAQFDKVGGTIITLARRIDASMKLKSYDAMLEKAQKLEAQISHTGGAVSQFARSSLKAYSTWSSMGDVAGKSVSSMMRLNLSRQIGQTLNLRFAFNSVSQTVNKLKISVISLGTELIAAFGGFMLVFKGVQFLKNSAKEASNLNETINKTGLIFGQQATMVMRASNEMASRYGIVKTSFLDIADQFGQLLEGMGRQSQAAAATTSANLARLAADASSLFNVSFEEAASKMSAAIRGQSEPISQFGIDVTEAAVKQEALRMGLVKIGQELDTSQKVAARTSLIFRGLAVAQGDLARTGEQPANAMRRFIGSMQNAGASLMIAFLPAIQRGLGLLNEFATWLNNAFVRNSGSINAFAMKIASAIDTVGKYLRNLPVVWEVVKLKFEEGIANLIAIFKSIPDNLKAIGAWVAEYWPALLMRGIGLAIKGFMGLLKIIVTIGSKIMEALPSIALAIGQAFATILVKGLKGGLNALLTGGALELPALVMPQFADLSKEIEAKMKAIEASRPAAVAPAIPGMPGGAGVGAPRGMPTPLDIESMDSLKKLQDKAKAAFDETRTPLEKFRARMAELGQMFQKGLISKDTYERARKAAFEEFGSKAKSVFDETRTPLERFQAKLVELKALLDQGLISKDTYERAKKSATDEISEKAKSVFEATRTPLEKFQAKTKELDEMLTMGTINQDTYDRAVKAARSESFGQHQEPRYAGAAQIGSTEAYSAILQYGGRNRGEDSMKQVAKATTGQTKILERIATAVERGTAPGQGGPLQRADF